MLKPLWTLLALLGLLLGASAEEAVETVEGGKWLELQFPPALREGRPKPIKVHQLAPELVEAPRLLVPAGTRLLSKGKPVSSSDDAPIIGALELITDGDKQAGEGYFVELLDGLQWVQIDLQKTSVLYAVALWHFHSHRRAYHDVIVQVSDDPEFRKGVVTLFNNDHDNSAGLGRGLDLPYVETRFGLLVNGRGEDGAYATGRYLRCYSHGNTANEMNHYLEIEVHGEQ